MLVFLIFVVAAAEIAIGIPIVLLLVRSKRVLDLDAYSDRKGLRETMGPLTWIVVLPLLGFMVNGLIGRRGSGHASYRRSAAGCRCWRLRSS